jgi:hypothetical protein
MSGVFAPKHAFFQKRKQLRSWLEPAASQNLILDDSLANPRLG